jgi:hypothetical protein
MHSLTLLLLLCVGGNAVAQDVCQIIAGASVIADDGKFLGKLTNIVRVAISVDAVALTLSCGSPRPATSIVEGHLTLYLICPILSQCAARELPVTYLNVTHLVMLARDVRLRIQEEATHSPCSISANLLMCETQDQRGATMKRVTATLLCVTLATLLLTAPTANAQDPVIMAFNFAGEAQDEAMAYRGTMLKSRNDYIEEQARNQEGHAQFQAQQEQAAANLRATQLQNERNERLYADETEARARANACHYEPIIINGSMTMCTVCPARHTTTCNRYLSDVSRFAAAAALRFLARLTLACSAARSARHLRRALASHW